jgi:hypothetical protein
MTAAEPLLAIGRLGARRSEGWERHIEGGEPWVGRFAILVV